LVAKDGDKDLIPHEEVQVIFNDVDVLVTTNTALLKQLEPLLATWHPYTSLVGAVFLNMVRTPPPSPHVSTHSSHSNVYMRVSCGSCRALSE
jgi:hypothetical protein